MSRSIDNPNTTLLQLYVYKCHVVDECNVHIPLKQGFGHLGNYTFVTHSTILISRILDLDSPLSFIIGTALQLGIFSLGRKTSAQLRNLTIE